MPNKKKTKIIDSLHNPITFIVIAFILMLAGGYYLRTVKDNRGGAVENTIGRVDNFTSVKFEGWGAGWYTQPEYDGDDMPIDALVEANNIDFDVKKSIAPRLGSKVLGTKSASTTPIISIYTAHALDGRELLLRTYEDVIEWWNEDNETWETLATGYTANQSFTFVDGMTSTETANYTYFANGVDALKRFRIAFGSLATTTGATTTLNSVSGFDSADDIGFNPSGGTVTINGNNYNYSGISGWSLTGMSGVPTNLPANIGVIHAVEGGFTDAPDSAVSLVIKDQRLYAAYKNSVYCSRIDDFRDFSYSAPRNPSEGEVVIFPDGGDKITGLAVRPTYVAVFKKDFIGSIEFKDFSENLSDIAVLDTIAKGIDIGAVNNKSIANKNEIVIFANNDIGITELTRLAQTDFDRTIALTERIRPTIEDYDFTDGAVGIYKNKILHSVKDDSDFNNTIIVYDILYNRFTKFTGWNANAFTIYNDKLYYADSVTKNVYEAFTSNYDDDDLPYTTEWKTKWINFGYPDLWKEIDYVFVEGFINKQTSLDFTIYLDEGGALTSKTITITGTGDYVSEASGSGFGTNPFGLSNFGDIEESGDDLLHFAGYIMLDDLFAHKFRNIQFGGKTSGTGQNYRISKIIPYVNVLEPTWGQSYDEFTIP